MTRKCVRNTSNTVFTQVNYIDFSKATKVSSLKYADIGDTITYTIVLPNKGNVPATNVFFSDTIANGSIFVPNSVIVNGISKPGVDPVTGFNIGTILSNGAATITFKVLVTG
ncbi:MAG: DUF11 domain-containing protein [Clostridium sp.]